MEKRKTNILKLFEDAKAESKYLKISAPMVRYSKLEFRQLLRKYGTDVCFTPMIIADSFCRSEECRNNEFTTSQIDSPLITQFAAKNSSEFVTATQLVYAYSDGIDLNCGCPQNWAIKKGYGCSLLKNPQMLFQIIRELHNSLPEMHNFTCSYKIRLLENQQIRKTIDLCQQLESCGLSFLTIHGRTSWQKYTDPCNYEAIAEIKQCMKIPIVYNGDINSYEDANLAYHRTKCDGIMAARALLTNPMLFDEKHKTINNIKQALQGKRLTEENRELNSENSKFETNNVIRTKISKENSCENVLTSYLKLKLHETVIDEDKPNLEKKKKNYPKGNIKLHSGKGSKTDIDISDLKSITECVMEWIALNLNASKQQYQTFHHHLVFMLEKYLSKIERLQFNNLKHKNQIYNFLNNKFELNIKLSDLAQPADDYVNGNKICTPNISNLSYIKTKSHLKTLQQNNKILLNYDNSLIEKYKLRLIIPQSNRKESLEGNKYFNNSQSEGKYFKNFKVDANVLDYTEDTSDTEFFFINQTIFDL